ncbi:excinuclease ABC subunit UvrC [Fibrobacterales bacterium]|nr:excinuclease ABC subunit UvrC [Fibrobacterales bacterium]
MIHQNVDSKLKLLPTCNGIYLMKNKVGEIIYIGKAKNLKNRVRSYFRNGSTDHRAAELMVPYICDIDWIVTATEVEALLLEANLVQGHQPRYNVRLKDDKHFPYLMVTKEAFPRLKVVRKVRKDKNTYFGPYVNVRLMRKIIELVPQIFRIRECDLKLPLKEPVRPCLSYHIKRCDAPCADIFSEEAYAELVSQLKRFLDGNHSEIIEGIKTKMQLAASRLDFEKAGEYRDTLKELDSIVIKQNIDSLEGGVDRDLVAVECKGDLASVALHELRGGQLMDRHSWSLNCPLEQGYAEILVQVLITHYSSTGSSPSQIHFWKDYGVVDILNEALPSLPQFLKKGDICKIPQRGEKKKLLAIASQNAHMLLMRNIEEKARALNIESGVAVLQKELNMKVAPIRIEGYDISHLSGTDTVASGVCFKNGRPSKSDYKRYNVRTVEGIDDFASMREILGRRCLRLIEDSEKSEWPDLILIDGGKGQINAAYEVMVESGIEIPMIGIAKREEEIWYPHTKEPILLSKSNPGLKLLQRIRDESHRFAITFQKSKRVKTIKTLTWLESVPGLGQKSVEKLRNKYQTSSQLKKATKAELLGLLTNEKKVVNLMFELGKRK